MLGPGRMGERGAHRARTHSLTHRLRDQRRHTPQCEENHAQMGCTGHWAHCEESHAQRRGAQGIERSVRRVLREGGDECVACVCGSQPGPSSAGSGAVVLVAGELPLWREAGRPCLHSEHTSREHLTAQHSTAQHSTAQWGVRHKTFSFIGLGFASPLDNWIELA